MGILPVYRSFIPQSNLTHQTFNDIHIHLHYDRKFNNPIGNSLSHTHQQRIPRYKMRRLQRHRENRKEQMLRLQRKEGIINYDKDAELKTKVYRTYHLKST